MEKKNVMQENNGSRQVLVLIVTSLYFFMRRMKRLLKDTYGFFDVYLEGYERKKRSEELSRIRQ